MDFGIVWGTSVYYETYIEESKEAIIYTVRGNMKSKDHLHKQGNTRKEADTVMWERRRASELRSRLCWPRDRAWPSYSALRTWC